MMQDLGDLVTEIPVINDNIVHTIFTRRKEQPEEFDKEGIDYLIEDNLNLSRFLGYISDKYGFMAIHAGLFMYRMLKMKGDVPKVTEETFTKVFKEYEFSQKNKYVIEVLEGVKNKDCALFNFVRRFSESTGNPNGVIHATMIMYKMLETQAEMNKRKIN